MKNTCKRNFLISLALVIVGSGMLIYSGARAFSYEADTAYTEFYFTGDFGSGSSDFPIFNVDGASANGAEGSFQFELENLSSQDFSGRFSFVDAVSLIAGTNVYGCKGENDSTFFTQDAIWVNQNDNNTFSVEANRYGIYTANYNFNQKVSGTYTGCVVYTPDGTIQDGVADAVPRKALIFAVNLTGTNPSHQVTMIANLGQRVYADNTYPGGFNPNYYGYTSSGLILFYNINDISFSNPVISGYVAMDYSGVGIMDPEIQVPNGLYNVVYKGWHHLAVSMTGLDYQGQIINFVSGNNIDGLYDGSFEFNSQVYSPSYNGGTGYLLPGDIPALDMKYDGSIDLGDLSSLTTNRCNWQNTNVNSYCDLNHDLKVDTDDVVILVTTMNIMKNLGHETDGIGSKIGEVSY